MARARAPRRHGCEAPLHPSQVAVVAIGLLSAVVFDGFSVQELPELMQCTLVPLYSVQLVTTALLFFIISRYDPGWPPHPTAYPSASSGPTCKEGVIAVSIETASRPKASPELLASHAVVAVCRDCGRLALTSNTRHCSRCRKCIPGYDHHCIYLNTCIGKHNYALFAGLLSCSTLLLLTQQLVTGFAVSCLLASGRDDGSKTRAAHAFSSTLARALVPRSARHLRPVHRVARPDHVRVALPVAGTAKSQERNR